MSRKKTRRGLKRQFGGIGLGNWKTPGPLIGPPWTPSISTWPGVQGQQGVTNYFKDNQYHVDPQVQMLQTERDVPWHWQRGGSRHGSMKRKNSNFSYGPCITDPNSFKSHLHPHFMISKKSQKQGKHRLRFCRKLGIWKGGRRRRRQRGGAFDSIKYYTRSAYNTLNGIKAPVNPLPWKDQLSNP